MGANYPSSQMDPRFQYQQQGSWVPNQIPIIKNYNINVSGPSGNHAKISAIYEDILPSKEFLNTPNTLGERRNIYNFIRSIFIKQGDGEDIDLDEKGSNSLLRYLKFMELNPYNANQMSDNPYKGLPDGMLIYKSCYPIRYNKHDNNIECAKNSIGMNIRIYKMSVGEYSIRKLQQANYYDYEMWREIAYYEYIREQILKANVCPNFVMLYGYYINENCNINFDKLSQIKGKFKQPQPEYHAVNGQDGNYKPISIKNGYPQQNPSNFVQAVQNKGAPVWATPTTHVPGRGVVLPTSLNRPFFGGNGQPSQQTDHTEQTKKALQEYENEQDLRSAQTGGNAYIVANDPVVVQSPTVTQYDLVDVIDVEYNPKLVTDPGLELQKNPLAYSGRALVSLTEAPTQNIYSWSSKTYKKEGNIKRMVSTGYHKSDVWLSVLFQLMAALYTLQIHKIAFKDFKINDNVYIKDIPDTDNMTKYWKYNIDGIDYYIPNYGYLVLIDSNYKDIVESSYTLSNFGQNKNQKDHKIYSTIFEGDGATSCDSDKLDEMCFKAFKECFSLNSFSNSFTSIGGVKPPDDALDVIKRVETMINQKTSSKIGDYIGSCMGKFLNNRTGTYLKETEIANIRKDDHTAFRKGRLVVHEVQHETFKFVLFKELSKDPDGQQAIIYTKKDNNAQDPIQGDIVETTIRMETLFNYSNYESITQNYKANEAKLNDEELLETYVIAYPDSKN